MDEFNTEYWPRTLDETFDTATEPGSDEAQGWRVTIRGVSHTLPLGGGVQVVARLEDDSRPSRWIAI
jgi:hypothetical protein